MKLLLPPVLLTIIAASWTPDTTPGSGRQDREVRGLNSHLILHNGKVYTGDSERPWVEAIAIRNGVIEAVGDSKTVKTVAWSSEAMSIDLGGRFACPGFVDAHGHVASLGRTMRSLDLVGTRSFGDVVKRARDRITTLEKGEWVVGRGWDQNDWKEKSFPHHGALSKASPDHPAWLVRIDGHAGIANDRALEIAGITKEIPDPEGGRIVRDPETGAATGVLVDAAMSLVTRHIPSMEKAQIRKDILAAQSACLAVGLTEIHDAGIGSTEIEIYRELDRAGLLELRIYGMASGDLSTLQRVFSKGPILPDRNGRFTLRSIKAVADGALGSRGAALLADYADDPGNRGLMTIEKGELLEIVRWAIQRGLQVGTHAIGDAANRMTLDVYEEATRSRRGDSPRLRVEHAQVLAPEDIARFGQLGVIASMQPTHCTSDMPWAGLRLGAKRLAGAYAWRSLLESGARVASGSDFPVESANPLWGFYAAVSRMDHDAKPEGGWNTSERMTREEAIRTFTVDAAYAAFEEGSKGTLAPGMWADIVILDKNILKVEPADLLRTRVWATIVGGKVVYRAR